MKKYLLLGNLLLSLSLSSQSDLNYSTDLGIRIDSATTRKAIFRNDTIFVYYGYKLWDGSQIQGTGLAIATDKPDYNLFTKVNPSDYPLYNYTLMPDGSTWRQYSKDPATDSVISYMSTDGKVPQPESGARYVLDSSDNGKFGVHSTIVDQQGNVHLYYMGDGGNQPQNMNNVRHALSVDSGYTFTFQSDDVCGDLGVGGFYTYVDPDVVLLNNGHMRMFVMNPHGLNTPPSVSDPVSTTIHSYYSQDNGVSFVRETTLDGKDTILQCSDMNVHSLNDPKVVQLGDGRIKVFVNGLTFEGDSTYQWDIYSFTSKIPMITNEETISTDPISIYPNPVQDLLHISSNGSNCYELYSSLGSKLDCGCDNKTINTSTLKEGIYFLKAGGEVKKIFKE